MWHISEKRERKRGVCDCCVYFKISHRFQVTLGLLFSSSEKGEKWVLREMKLIASLPPWFSIIIIWHIDHPGEVMKIICSIIHPAAISFCTGNSGQLEIAIHLSPCFSALLLSTCYVLTIIFGFKTHINNSPFGWIMQPVHNLLDDDSLSCTYPAKNHICLRITHFAFSPSSVFLYF